MAIGETIVAGGTVILGQEQDSEGGGFSTSESLVGMLFDVQLSKGFKDAGM